MPIQLRNPDAVRLGLRRNWDQFALLLLVNAFVGAMVGLERAVLPLLAEEEFGLASRTAILAFVATFGLTKALANLAAGRLADRVGRKPVLIAGWLFGIPVPLMIIAATSWTWIVFANVLLGMNQGLAWSTTVIMKVDLVGPRRRGLAMGLNEATGYMAVSLAALASGYVAATYALRPQPFYLGIAFSVIGLLLTVVFVRDTKAHARLEARGRDHEPGLERGRESKEPAGFAHVLLLTSWKNRALFAASQAGLVNNLNDGMAWGLFPLYFAALGISVEKIGILAALYPAVWGIGQLGTGILSDTLGRKPLIVAGMWVQAAGIAMMLMSEAVFTLACAMVLLGLGTALVYPTLLAAVGDVAHPSWRASSIGVYRLWRDGGYVVGAVAAGLLADLFGMGAAIAAVGALTAASGIVVALVMYETYRGTEPNAPPS